MATKSATKFKKYAKVLLIMVILILITRLYPLTNRFRERKPLSEAKPSDIVNVFDEIYWSEYNRRNLTISHSLLKIPVRPSLALVEEVELSPIDHKMYENYYYAKATYKKSISNERNHPILSFGGTNHIFSMFSSVRVSDEIEIIILDRYYVDTKMMERDYILVLYEQDSKSRAYIEKDSISDLPKIKQFIDDHQIVLSDINKAGDAFTYDMFIKDWLEVNGKYSRFSQDDIGEFFEAPSVFNN
ncbi:TipC family immunity protein [uncultured Vagococcus sp.]|uniref:TipC family immunity protein n=1 Tax=uncultured Vagococcus sp. TaxID=189676 RepID=UPI0028D7C7F7|nr:TipC family immunity protein [uncultured Vagococcus sp.]